MLHGNTPQCVKTQLQPDLCGRLSSGISCRRYLAVRATPGDWGLNDLAIPLLRQALRCGNPDYIQALFDAGAGPSDAAVRRLWDLVEQEHPRLDVTEIS